MRCVFLSGFAFILLSTWSAGQEFKLEPGFTLLFNGKNLDGWKTRAGGKSLDGKAEAYKGRFKVVEGTLVIDPKVRGDVIIDTARELKGDVHIKFEFLPGTGCNNDLFFRGIKFDLIPKTVKGLKLGEWNEFDIIATGKKVEYRCNGVVERTTTAKGVSSAFGIRAEYGPIQFRRLRVKEMP